MMQLDHSTQSLPPDSDDSGILAETSHLRDISLQLGRREAALRESLYRKLTLATVGDASAGSLRVLDVGCGRGELLSRLQTLGHQVAGIDVEPACVEVCRQFAPVERGGFEDLSRFFQPGAFDVIVSSHVIEHVDDPLGCLGHALSLRAKRYVIAVPNVHRSIRLVRAVTSSMRPDHPTHIYGWGRPEFRALLNRAGLDLVAWHCDRVTVNPFSGGLGTFVTRIVNPLETRLLPRIFPGLSSSLIAECRPMVSSEKDSASESLLQRPSSPQPVP